MVTVEETAGLQALAGLGAASVIQGLDGAFGILLLLGVEEPGECWSTSLTSLSHPTGSPFFSIQYFPEDKYLVWSAGTSDVTREGEQGS